jgi:transcriptional/translational regulatory protein YebC/TACO1
MKNSNLLKQIIKEEILKVLSEGENKKTWEVKFKYVDKDGRGTAEEEMTQEKKPTAGDIKVEFNKAYGKITDVISVKEKK